LSHFHLSNSVHSLYLSIADASTDKMLVLFRNWKNKQASSEVERLKRILVEKLPAENLLSLA
jgi:hypothetical protein